MAEPAVSIAKSPTTQDAGPVALLASPWGVPRTDGGLWAKDPSAVRFGDRYLMYFSLAPTRHGTNQGLRVGIAESTDLLSWRVIGTLDPAGDYDARGVAAPGAVVLGGVVHLFYQTYGNGRLDAICHAWSTDGVNFTRDSSNPVFRPSGRWNCGRAIDADVIVDDDRLLLAYATRDPKMRVQMVGIAATPLAGSFSRTSWRDLSAEAPALKPELPWERDCIEAPAFVRRGERLLLFYAGAYNNEPQQIGYAISDDGITWTRETTKPFLPHGELGSWNSSESGHPGVLTDDDGRTFLFFQGNDSGGRTNLLAVTEIDWEGDRPVLRRNPTPDRTPSSLQRPCSRG